jgi:hypothetical protein
MDGIGSKILTHCQAESCAFRRTSTSKMPLGAAIAARHQLGYRVSSSFHDLSEKSEAGRGRRDDAPFLIRGGLRPARRGEKARRAANGGEGKAMPAATESSSSDKTALR